MKKLVSFIILYIITSIYPEQLSAQAGDDTPLKRFGLFAGMNTSNMNFNKGYRAPAVPIKSKWKSGITIGFLMQVTIAKDLFLQPEYHYTQKKGADKSTGINYSSQYFSFPLLLNYNFSSRFAILAGPQAELLIHATADSNGVQRNITHDVEERSIGVVIGFDVRLINSFFISVRYLHGLNHIGIGQRSDIKEFKYEVVNLSIGVRF